MALTDIVNYEGVPMSYEMNRGNIGVVDDLQSEKLNAIEIPATAPVSSGNIFIMSE